MPSTTGNVQHSQAMTPFDDRVAVGLVEMRGDKLEPSAAERAAKDLQQRLDS